MLLNSPIFLKAVATIAKQQGNTPVVPISSSSKGKKKKNPTGMFLFLLIQCAKTLNICIYISVSLTQFLNTSDVDLIAHARDVVTNSVMAEVAKEDPQGQSEYQDAIRHQVVAFFQRIRLSLLVLDTLMEEYNSSK